MKVVISIVLNNFKNDSRVLKEAISLQNAGYKVKVVALHEEPLEEYDNVENISIHRIKLRSRNWLKHKPFQLLKYFEFIYRVVKHYKNIDMIHCNDLETLPIGIIIKKFFNKDINIVYDAHEYEIERHGIKGIRKFVTKKLEYFLIKDVDKVITVSDTIANEYVRLYNIQKPALVLNTPPLREIDKTNLFRETFNISEDATIFLYQGSLNKGRGIETILETFKELNEDKVVVFMGYGNLDKLIKENMNRYNNIYFHRAVSPNVVLEYTSSADFGLSLIEDTCLSYRYCLPNKMFEYLMAGIPVIVSNLPEMKKIVKNFDIGIVIENSLKESIVEVMSLDKKILKKNIKVIKDIYNWKEQENVLIGVYSEF